MKGMVLGICCRTYQVYSYREECLVVRGNAVGILVIGSYVYHLDVIATGMQISVNIIQIRITYWSPIYCIYKHVQMSQCSSDI